MIDPCHFFALWDSIRRCPRWFTFASGRYDGLVLFCQLPKGHAGPCMDVFAGEANTKLHRFVWIEGDCGAYAERTENRDPDE